jgi:dTMP kinase
MNNHTKPYAGSLISIEGIDGSGKTTLAHRLAQALHERNIKTLLTLEPGGTKLGTSLREILHGQKSVVCDKAEFLLFAADRAQHFKQIITPALHDGIYVIADRLADSSLAYQGYGRGLDCNMITTINKWAMGDIVPDLTIYLRINPEAALARVHGRKEQLTSFEQEKLAFWERVTEGYETIFANRDNVVILDAMMPQDVLCDQSVDAVMRMHE